MLVKNRTIISSSIILAEYKIATKKQKKINKNLERELRCIVILLLLLLFIVNVT